MRHPPRAAGLAPDLADVPVFESGFDADQAAVWRHQLFPEPAARNAALMIPAGREPGKFFVLAVNSMPDLSLWTEVGRSFPYWTFPQIDGVKRVDNIPDSALRQFRRHYGHQVSRDDIFFYVYALLHSPTYQDGLGAVPRLPSVPLVASNQPFWALAQAGSDLFHLHIKFADAPPWPGLAITGDIAGWDDAPVTLMTYGQRLVDGLESTDKTVIICNQLVTVSGLPLSAQRYRLGTQSGLDRLVEHCSGRDRWVGDSQRQRLRLGAVQDMLAKVVTISLRTVAIVDSLPKLEFRQRP